MIVRMPNGKIRLMCKGAVSRWLGWREIENIWGIFWWWGEIGGVGCVFEGLCLVDYGGLRVIDGLGVVCFGGIWA